MCLDLTERCTDNTQCIILLFSSRGEIFAVAKLLYVAGAVETLVSAVVVNCDGGGDRSGRAVTMVYDNLSFQTLRETLRHLTDMLLSLRNRNGSDECIIICIFPSSFWKVYHYVCYLLICFE